MGSYQYLGFWNPYIAYLLGFWTMQPGSGASIE